MMNLKSRMLKQGAAFVLLLSFAGACGDHGGGGSGSTTPTVMSSTPTNVAVDVPVNGSITANFSEAMNPATLTLTSFTVSSGSPAVDVAGTVIYANGTASFWPSAHLSDNTTFTATVTTGATSAPGVALAANYVWSFTTGITVAPGQGVNLGAAGNFVILSKSGISTVPASAITGNIGVSPAAATLITGFSLTADPSNVFATSPQVVGNVYAADYAPPTPSNLTTSVGDMELAFTDAAGRAPDVTELGAGNIGGMNLVSGVYKWGTGLLIPTDITLTGSATDVWIFQIAQDLTVGNTVNITLAGGAQAQNIYWQVAGFVDVGTTAHVEGIFMCQTAITLHTGASAKGRLLAQTAVVLDQNAVTQP